MGEGKIGSQVSREEFRDKRGRKIDGFSNQALDKVLEQISNMWFINT